VDVRIRQRQKPVLITSAADPRHVDIRRREGQYLFWMGFRVLIFVLAVVLFHGWLRFVAVAAALLIPWVAVVVANGGPAPSRRRPAGGPGDRPGGPGPAALDVGEHRVVDTEPTSGAGPEEPTSDGRPGADSGTAPGGRPAGPGEAADSGDQPAGDPFEPRGEARPGERPPFAPPYTPPRRQPSGDVGFFGPRRPPRSGRR
jgi:hypothetical protein